MPLPSALYEEFDIIARDTTDENAYNAAWNMLLVEYFPLKDGWVVIPQVRPLMERREFLDDSIYFKVQKQKIPAMVVEIKPLVSLRSLSARRKADMQVRERFRELFEASPSVTYGLSAFGTRICVYTLDKNMEKISPKAIVDEGVYIVDTAPADRWSIDLMTDAGYEETMQIFTSVKNAI